MLYKFVSNCSCIFAPSDDLFFLTLSNAKYKIVQITPITVSVSSKLVFVKPTIGVIIAIKILTISRN